jgi:hypothetical protein
LIYWRERKDGGKNGNQFWINFDCAGRPVFSGDLPRKLRMETMVILGLFLALLLVISIDTRQKRRKYLDKGK